MNNDLIDILSQSVLFNNIKKTDIKQILSQYAYKIDYYTKNDVFALAGDSVNNLILVLKGTLIARMVSDSGKYIQMDKIEKGRLVAPAMIFASNNIFPVNVMPEDEVSVLLMRKEVFLKAMNKNEQLLFNFMQIVSDINHFLSSKIHSLSLKTIRGKLAEFILLELDFQKSSSSIRLKQTRQELADRFAVSRQALIRSLTELEDEGLITIKGRVITLLDKHGLKNKE